MLPQQHRTSDTWNEAAEALLDLADMASASANHFTRVAAAALKRVQEATRAKDAEAREKAQADQRLADAQRDGHRMVEAACRSQALKFRDRSRVLRVQEDEAAAAVAAFQEEPTKRVVMRRERWYDRAWRVFRP